MNERKIYNERLLRFADHLSQFTSDNPHPEYGLLSTVKIVTVEQGESRPIHIPYEAKYHYWVVEEIVALEDWYYDRDTGEPKWEDGDQNESSSAHIIDYFNLTLDQFSHLFALHHQFIDRFGGELLTIDSHGDVIARNIIELVSSEDHSRPDRF